MQYVPFCVGLFSLSTVLLKFIHVVECNIFFFFSICLTFILVGFGGEGGEGTRDKMFMFNLPHLTGNLI